MRSLAQILALILLLSSGVLCFANEMGSSERSSPTLTAQSQQSEGQLKVKSQPRKDTHRLQRMMDQRDWDHRKTGRDWRMRGDHENLGH